MPYTLFAAPLNNRVDSSNQALALIFSFIAFNRLSAYKPVY